MNSYKFNTSIFGSGISGMVQRDENAFIPINPDNTNYAKFLKDWEAGAEVLNPDGTPAPYVAPEAK